jgi:hypothetical protein
LPRAERRSRPTSRFNILADWLREGDPGSCVGEIVRDAGLSFGSEHA